ncbi:hypothetical protein ACFU99_35965 [Streptomyces sp. NPDC057654]|uniref:DUF6197 family protein n=1 Tax=Streptomyces sp. NPDC057654 TaxID=3346196 RepID=UPI003694308C
MTTPTPTPAAVTPREVAAVLEDAARIIKTNGWYQGQYYDFDQAESGTPIRECRVCLVGAINIAADGDPYPSLWDVSDKVVDACAAVRTCLLTDGEPPVLADWNDAPDRTATDVVTLLRDTARVMSRP